MKRLLWLFLSMAAFFPFIISAAASEPYYKSDAIPSNDIILKNLEILQGPSSKGLGHQGKVKLILGVHHQIYTNTYLVYYCYKQPRKNRVYGTRENDVCFSDVALFKLDSGVWIMKSTLSSEWVII